MNQEEADRDIPKLLAVPSRVRFLSIKPLLAPVALPRFCSCGCRKPLDEAQQETIDDPGYLNPDQALALASVEATLGIDWVIVGGESGPSARPMHPDWARSLRDQCAAAGVPFLFKQWGEWSPNAAPCGAPPSAPLMWLDEMNYAIRIGKKCAGRLLDGTDWSEFPEPEPGKGSA